MPVDEMGGKNNLYKDLRMVGIRNWFSVMVFLYISQKKTVETIKLFNKFLIKQIISFLDFI